MENQISMYTIEPTMYGIKLTFSGTIHDMEMISWVTDSVRILKTVHKPFSVLLDRSDLDLLNPEAKAILTAGQKLYESYGVSHHAVILQKEELEEKLKHIAEGIEPRNDRERCFLPEEYDRALEWVCTIYQEED